MSDSALSQQLRDFVIHADIYFEAARDLSCVFEAQRLCPLAGPDFSRNYQPAHRLWMDAKQAVLFLGPQLIKAMTAEGRKTKRLLKMLDAIGQDGERSGWPGGVDLEEWKETKARLLAIAAQAEGTVAGSPQAERAEGTVAAPPRKRGGRPADTDAKADKRIYDAWGTGSYRTYAELAHELGMELRKVKLAIDRQRQRLARAGQ